MRLLRSFNVRMFLSHVGVALITADIVTVLMLVVIWSATRNIDLDLYATQSVQYMTLWLMGMPDGLPNEHTVDGSQGFTLILSPEHTVLWSRGDTACRANMTLSDCAPELLALPEGARYIERNGERWTEVVSEMITGQRVVLQRSPFVGEPYFIVGEHFIYGYGATLLYQTISTAVLSLPVAFVLSWLFVRPQIQRIKSVMQISKRFANGDLTARIGDTRQDEVGQLAQQFDDMASALQQNINALRDLAQRNAELAQQAEMAAIQAERARLSRDLHDAVAQRLFSLSISTAALSELIATDQQRGIQQAKVISELAENTLLDLRALLVELRPSNVAQRGLGEALKTLCDEWQRVSLIPTECSLMLSGKHIPSPVEDTIYRITQEALSNIAKHARAHSIQISLVEGQRQMILSISDDGMGFDPNAITGNGKFGLNTMRERALSLGGQFVIESERGRGTTIQALLPIEPKY